MNPAGHSRPRDLRASDLDRAGVFDVLTDAYAEGRITMDEHEERMRVAETARTLGELVDLVSDLPGGAMSAGLPDLDDRHFGVVFGTRDRGGRWILPESFTTSAVGGTVTLDLTKAMFAANPVTVNALCLGGSLRVLRPPSVRVDVYRGRLVALRKVKARRVDAEPAYTVVIRARGVGQVTVRTVRPSRR